VKALAQLSIGLLLLCCACAKQPPAGSVAKREFPSFQREVYPVLLRDCAFPSCHGGPQRFLRVWGPGRVRLPSSKGTPGAVDLPSVDEISATYSLALSMIDDRDPAHSPLLRKPLAVAAGGAGHRGVDKYGRDVYRTAQDSGYLTLARWVLSAAPASQTMQTMQTTPTTQTMQTAPPH
jgi:hypothetical protein